MPRRPRRIHFPASATNDGQASSRSSSKMSRKSGSTLPALATASTWVKEFHRSLEAILNNASDKKITPVHNSGSVNSRKSRSVRSCIASETHREEGKAPQNSSSDIANLTPASKGAQTATEYINSSMTFPNLKVKFDDIVAEILEILNCVEDLKARAQFEYLLVDFRNMLLVDDKDHSVHIHPQFLDDIKIWLKGYGTEYVKIMDNQSVRLIHMSAAIKLMEAKDLQRQVAELHDYFNNIFRAIGQHSMTPGLRSSAKTVADGYKECWAEYAPCSAPVAEPEHIDDLLAQMQSFSDSVKHRERRIATLAKSNQLLSQQIEDVESTLECSNRYLENVRINGPPTVNDTLKREMSIFQETMIERIFSYMDTLYKQLEPLSTIKVDKSYKRLLLFANFQSQKKEEEVINSMIAKWTERDPSVAECRSKILCSKADLFTIMNAVVSGIDIFQRTCKEIWEEALCRISDETGALLKSRRKITTHEKLKADLQRLKLLPQDDTKFSATTIAALQMLETITIEFSRLMILTRLKDLQLISIDHKLGLVYVTLKRKTALEITNFNQVLAKPKKTCRSSKKKSFKRRRLRTSSTTSQICGKTSKKPSAATALGAKVGKANKSQTASPAPYRSKQDGGLAGEMADRCQIEDLFHISKADQQLFDKSLHGPNMHMAAAMALNFHDDSTDELPRKNHDQISDGSGDRSARISPWIRSSKKNKIPASSGCPEGESSELQRFLSGQVTLSKLPAGSSKPPVSSNLPTENANKAKALPVERTNANSDYSLKGTGHSNLPFIHKTSPTRTITRTGQIAQPASPRRLGHTRRTIKVVDEIEQQVRSSSRSSMVHECAYNTIHYKRIAPVPFPPPLLTKGSEIKCKPRGGSFVTVKRTGLQHRRR